MVRTTSNRSSPSLIDLPFGHLDDESFKLAIFELNQGLVSFSLDRFESLHFNPFNHEISIANTNDLDPDQ